MKRRKKLTIGEWLGLGLCLLLAAGAILLIVSGYVKYVTENQILTPEEAAKVTDADCILVLGCFVRPDGVPSPLLQDRLDRGVELYELGAADKIIMSGDHGQPEYNEVAAMKQYAMDGGVPSSDVFMDHAGFCTYDSIYRARDVFQAKKVIIVTQEYHLYRALYIANALGLDAYGVAANPRQGGQLNRDVREVLARNKDVLWCLVQPEPTYLGAAIPVSGNGDVTND